jgi:hypothetical protein
VLREGKVSRLGEKPLAALFRVLPRGGGSGRDLCVSINVTGAALDGIGI